MDKQWELSKNPLHQKVTFSKFVKSLDPKIEEWQIKFLKEQLFSDKFLEYSKYGDHEPYILTPGGIKAAQNGWYVPMEDNRILDKEIKKHSLKNLKRSRTIIIISILAVIIPTVISLYSLMTNKESPSHKQFKDLQQRIKTLEISKIDTGLTLKTPQKFVPDTLKKVSNNTLP